jgi:hypothetical protein
VPCSSAIFASRDCSSSALPWQRRARRKRKSQAAGTAALQLPRRMRRLRRARHLPPMLRLLHILLRQRHMSPPHASPRRTPHPPHTSPRPAGRRRHMSPHRARRHVLRPISPRRVPHRCKLPRRATCSKRLAQRRARRRVPQPGRAVRSPQPLPRMAAVTPGPGKSRPSQPQLRDNQTQPRDRA